jgi:hypothetical protein
MRTVLTTAIIAALLSGCATMGTTTKGHKDSATMAKATETPKMAEAPAFSPEEMKKAMIEAATPLPEHKELAAFTGTWKTTGKMWMDPTKKEPEVFNGKSVVTMEMGGKFLQEKYTGNWQGQAFNGTGVTSYNPLTKEYTSIWFDSASPVMSNMSGSYSKTDKTLTVAGSNYCPMAKSNVKSKMTHRVVSPTEQILESYVLTPDGKEMKAMEIAYKRIGK